MTTKEWGKKGKTLFGDDKKNWKFVCPNCKIVISGKDYIENNATSMFGFSCIGRVLKNTKGTVYNKKQPCDYAGGGLMSLNPVKIDFEDGSTGNYFDFADVQNNKNIKKRR